MQTSEPLDWYLAQQDKDHKIYQEGLKKMLSIRLRDSYPCYLFVYRPKFKNLGEKK